MQRKIYIVLSILLFSVINVDAEEMNKPSITPDSKLYNVKLWLEDLQETLSFNDAKKLILKQEHLQNRMNELRYEMSNNYNKNTEKLLQKIQIKRLEIEENLDKIKEESSFSNLIEMYPEIKQKYTTCNSNGQCGGGVSVDVFISDIKQRNIEVLTNLLNNPNMPEQSRKGLENALNNTMRINKTKISANMVQGTYAVNPTYLLLLPFTNVAVLDPNENKWYSIVTQKNKVYIMGGVVDGYEYKLYPTSKQLKSLEKIISQVNLNGLATKDKIQLLKLWYDIKKE